MAKEKLEYEVEFPISVKGQKKALKDMEKLEKSFMKFARNAQAASARINWGALAKSGTLGRTVSNIATKNLTDFMPHKSFARAGANIGSSFGKKMWGADMAADYAEKYQLNRLAKGKSLTSKAAMTGVNKAAGRGMVAAGAKGAAIGGMAGGALGGALMLLPAVIGLIVASSRMLQKTLGNIMKYLLMFLRPIGDMLAVIMYPLMMILRPLAMMVNTIIRPFLMEARKSFRLSLQLGKQAKTARQAGLFSTASQLEGASKDMMNLGLQTLTMGFSKMLVNISGELIKIFSNNVIDGLSLGFSLLANIVDGLTGGVFGLSEKVGIATQVAKQFVSSGIDLAVQSFNEYADDFLNNVKEKNENVNDLASYTKTMLSNIQSLNLDVPKFDGYLSDMWKTFKEKGIEAVTETQKVMDAYVEKAKAELAKIKPDSTKIDLREALLDFNTLPSSVFNEQVDYLNSLNDDLNPKIEESSSKFSFLNPLISSFGNLMVNTNPLVKGLNTGVQLSNVSLDLLKGKNIDMTSTLRDLVIPTFSSFASGLSNLASKLNSFTVKTGGGAGSSSSSSSSSSSKSLGSSVEYVLDGLGRLVKNDAYKGKASGGLVSENGMYYLHKGENVMNPVSSSFNNTAGSSNSLPSIEFNNCTFGGTEDWKKKMDEYFNKQMRHIR